MIATADLSGADFRVMAALMARLDFENLIQVQQVEIAEHLGMQKQNVGRSIKRLVEMGILLEGPKIGRSRSCRLNPNFGWQGSAKGHHRAIQERMKQAGLSVVKGGGQQEGSEGA
jgi:DNA-binding IclR family transcriptional regulator